MPRAFVKRLLKGQLAKNTVTTAFWQATTVGFQALWVVFAARLLGPRDYGAFSGVGGLATAIGGFTGLGLGLVMLQEVSRQHDRFSTYWQLAVRATASSGIFFCILFTALVPLYFDNLPVHAIALLGFSELLCVPLVTLAAFAFAAHELMGWSAILPSIMAFARFTATICYWAFARSYSIDTFVWFHAIGTSIGLVVALIAVKRELAPAESKATLRRQHIFEGLGFSLVWAVGNALGSLDKALVLRLAGSTTAGVYSIAYRTATVFALPVNALTMAAMPRLFRRGAGDNSHPRLLAQLALYTIGYSLLASALLWVVSGILPFLLGRDYASTTTAARWFAFFLPWYSLRVLGSNVLLASGRKSQRVMTETVGLSTMLLFAYLWIPRYGLMGAVATISLSEFVLAVLTWISIWHFARTPGTERRQT